MSGAVGRSGLGIGADSVLSVFFIASAAVAAAALTAQHFNWDFDDTFIIFRYAENILAGVGWRYNPGESYNASTSVLNTAIITAAGLVTKDPRAAAHVLDGVWIFISGGLIFLIFRERFGPAYASIAALLIITALGHDNTVGLETHLFIALALLFIYIEQRGWNSWPVLGLLVLARPDGMVILAGRAAVAWVRERKLPWAGLAQAALVLAPWLVFSLYSFGQVLPATLRQKMWQGRSGYWGHGLVYLHGFLRFLFHKALEWKWWAAVTAVLAYMGARAMVVERSLLLYLVLFAAAQQAAYVLLNVAYYDWYGAVFYVTALVCALYGAGLALMRVKKAALGRYAGAAWRFNPVGVNAAFGLSVLAFTALMSRQMLVKPCLNEAAESYKRLALEINSNTPAGLLASAEVGVLGYYTRREMLDLVGLTSNRGEFITGANNDAFFRILPCVVVLHNPLREYEMAVRADRRFAKHYVKQGSVEHGPEERLEYFILRGA